MTDLSPIQGQCQQPFCWSPEHICMCKMSYITSFWRLKMRTPCSYVLCSARGNAWIFVCYYHPMFWRLRAFALGMRNHHMVQCMCYHYSATKPPALVNIVYIFSHNNSIEDTWILHPCFLKQQFWKIICNVFTIPWAACTTVSVGLSNHSSWPVGIVCSY